MIIKEAYEKLVKNAVFAGAADLISKFKYFIFIPIFSKLTGAAGYGVWVQIMVTVNMLLPLATMGMDSGLIRFLPGKDRAGVREDIGSVSVIALLFSSAAGLLVIIFSRFLCVNFIKEPAYLSLVRLSGLYLTTFAVKELFLKYFRAMNKITIYSVFLAAESIISIAAVLIAILSGYGITGALLSLTIMNIVFLVLYFILITRDVGYSVPRFLNIRSYFNYCIPLIPMMWFLWANNMADRYIIGYFLNPKEVGIYAACYSISYFVIGVFSSPILVVVPPVAAKFWNEGDRTATRNIINRSIKYSLFFMIPCVFGFTLIAKPAISVITTKDFLGGFTTIPFILTGYLFYVIAALTENVILLFNKTRAMLTIYGVSAILNIFLNLMLIPKFGILGAAMTTALTFFILMLMIIFFTLRLGFFAGYDYMFILKTIFASFAMTVFMRLIRPDSMVKFALTLFIGAIVYLSIMIFLKAIGRTELNYVKKIVRLK